MLAKLNEIKTFLDSLRYPSHIVAPTEGIPTDQLAVVLEPDEFQRGRLLIIRSLPQDLSTMDGLLGITSSKRSYREIHLIVTLPFYVSEEKMAETARTILLINKGLAIKGFELSEADRLIFFHHAFVVPEDDLDARILLSLFGMIEILLETLSQTIESVATGKQPLAEIIRQAEDMIKNQNFV